LPSLPQAKKHFGQNFLIDETIIAAIVRAFAAKSTDHILEIGPGQGALTRHLLNLGTQLDVVEIDRDLVTVLQKKYPALQNHIHQQDALTFSIQSLISSSQKVRIIGNLPYNISTPLLFHLLSQRDLIEDMVFMLQQEVVARLAAEPGTKEYGRLSVMIQLQCEVRALFSVPPSAFHPRPKVMSQIVYLKPYATPKFEIQSFSLLENIVRDGFNQRRKTISNSLKAYFSAEQLLALGLDVKLRAEALTLQQWVMLANAKANEIATKV
jgi:16S rRNA (adenine1518-N6/adenine1519-N6)-dimethyltransferase